MPRCEEPVSGQQPRCTARFPPWTRRTLAGILPAPLGQACPAPCPAAGTARLHAASPPCPRGLLLFLLLRGRRVTPVSPCTYLRLAPTVSVPPTRLEEPH